MARLGSEAQQASPADPEGAAGSGRAPSGSPAAISVEGIAKRFGRVVALDDVSLSVRDGSVHALVGENGAGKSTLGKIMGGTYSPDRGQLYVGGAAVSLRSPREAIDHGIVSIAQELSIVPHLSVEQNVMLGAEPRATGFIRGRSLRRAYEEVAATVGFELPPGALAGRLRVAEQQQVEILRALSREAQVIIMDEPTAALSATDSEKLHEAIRALSKAGKTILLISHFLREVLDLADTVTVLRDGRIVTSTDAGATTEQGLVEAMLGRPLTAAFPAPQFAPAGAPPALTVRKLTAPGIHDVSLEIRAGEIVGLAGLIGAGRTELARAIVGVTKATAGEASTPTHRLGRSPRESLHAGVAMIPESRKDEGLIPTRSVLENVSLPRLPELSSLGMVRRGAERRAVSTVLEQCDVRGAGPGAPVRTLSGGNQQKVLFARMFLSAPRVVIADEPTRGVDIGAKRAIYDLLVALAADGLGVLLISSELEEIIGLSHRVLVMRGGRIAAELAGPEINERAILTAAFAEVAKEAA